MLDSLFQLVDISKLGLNSKIKKFSYSFICGKGYSPPFGGRIVFCLQPVWLYPKQGAYARTTPLRMMMLP